MQFSKITISIVIVALLGTVKASPRPEEYHKEIGCFAYPATTRTPFCTPN